MNHCYKITCAHFCQQKTRTKNNNFTQTAFALLNVRRNTTSMLLVHRLWDERYSSATERVSFGGTARRCYNRTRIIRQVKYTSIHVSEHCYCMYQQHIMYLFHYHRLFCDLENVKCKLVEVHCDKYAFNLKNQHPFSVMMSYIHIQYIYKYLLGHVLLYQNSKWQKMAAVCLWLIENKSLQMYVLLYLVFLCSRFPSKQVIEAFEVIYTVYVASKATRATRWHKRAFWKFSVKWWCLMYNWTLAVRYLIV